MVNDGRSTYLVEHEKEFGGRWVHEPCSLHDRSDDAIKECKACNALGFVDTFVECDSRAMSNKESKPRHCDSFLLVSFSVCLMILVFFGAGYTLYKFSRGPVKQTPVEQAPSLIDIQNAVHEATKHFSETYDIQLSNVVKAIDEVAGKIPQDITKTDAKVVWYEEFATMSDSNGIARYVDLGFYPEGTVRWRFGSPLPAKRVKKN
jgi:hypothetical protein